MTSLWRRRQRNRVPAAAYAELGADELLARQATQVVEGLPAAELASPAASLLRLLRPMDGSAAEAMGDGPGPRHLRQRVGNGSAAPF